jgi:hypothetical protein
MSFKCEKEFRKWLPMTEGNITDDRTNMESFDIISQFDDEFFANKHGFDIGSIHIPENTVEPNSGCDSLK